MYSSTDISQDSCSAMPSEEKNMKLLPHSLTKQNMFMTHIEPIQQYHL